jgi:spermidine synthase
MSFAPKVENVLIIGYGLGATTETILKMEDVRKVTLVEISNTLIKNLKKMPFFNEMLTDSRIDLIIDDGRRFLLRTQEKFDLILIDPLKTTTSYSNNLYSHQFFELAHQHLNPGGVFMVWMDENRVMPKTVLSVFDQIRVYNLKVYNFFCLASEAPFKINNERRKSLLNSFSPKERKLISKQGKYLGDQAYIKEVADRYPINQDWKPVCEYYLGLKVKEGFFLRKR